MEVISIEFLKSFPIEHVVEVTRQNLVNVGHEVTLQSLIAQGFHPDVANVIIKRATQKFAKQGT